MLRHNGLTGMPIYKLILGFGLCTLGGAMLYTYFKNRDEDKDMPQPKPVVKQKRKPQRNDEEVKINFEILNEHIPLCVGRGGSNLKSIEQQTSTKIHLRDKNDKYKSCDIFGTTDGVKQARALLLKEIERAPIVKEEIFVPQSVCGKIMGRCGEAMQEICRISLAKVTVDSGSGRSGGAMDKRRILLTGNQQQVNIARKLIEEKIEEDEDLRRAVEEVEHRREPRRSPSNSINSSMYSSQTSLSSYLPPREKLLASRNEDKPMEVYVSAIASPSKFWVQIIGPQSKKLDDMVQSMTEYYSEPENKARHQIVEPYLGQIVAAVFKYDGKWYRAEIVGILPNQYNPNDVVLDLYFVDYGDSEYVSPHEVFELRTDFLTLRFQAVECFLAGVKSTMLQDADTWDALSIQKFEELTQVANWKKLISRATTYKERQKGASGAVRESSPIPGVELFDLTEGVEVNIGHILISHGFALPADDLPRPRSPYYLNPSATFHRNENLSNGKRNKSTDDEHFLEDQYENIRTNNNLYADNADNKIGILMDEQTADNLTNLSAPLMNKKSTEALENSNLHIKNGNLNR
ncbi:tudor and KH domain-containing protein homolog [Bactrocera dorsalis]|uniref:Tudor and KH domain-containing protein homolog n=1 Tax=Bactrocera dorsalis TaxID=27457 RepID=A0A6J0RIS0_BACDO|nr:tudor and KH domain-containing protein homolog [Bactrocera dorsalis]XP_011207760.2 tudor and KH domain-containing protein homolog [Bactrocera dorsalis]XP_011207761.2 tudor and KH domain-containing protein homolog [Bactrocera dorsalis]XP_011207762.2 tudor and KH domain-containing protein homolog [Bactrocera dorsalis]XP_011207763.2 tudor and KH domain-containing protein homolog [Bactrocera dorsalis]XP_019846943.2 tudor and KH domain-containing protein homolog [Bactrocera dorsalis]XP_04931783